MPGSSKGWSSTKVKPRRRAGGRARRVVTILMLIFSLVVFVAGIISFAMAVTQQQEAAHVAAAPTCASGQRAGCKLDERVIVTNLDSEEAARSGYVSQVVQVRTPDGTSQTVYSHDQDFGLWSRLHVNEQVNAELWDGNIFRLDDGTGHYLLAGDDPGGSYFTGVLLVVLGGLMVGFFVRVLWRQRV
jgi:hypothetical protein